MTKKKTNPIQELIHSKEIIINDKFLVKVSMMDTGAFKKSYLIVVKGLVDNGFKMQYFNTDEEATQFLQMLHLI